MSETCPRILVRMPNWLGDAVMALPVLQDLKEKWPTSTLTALCQGGVGQLLAGNPYVDALLSFNRPKRFFFHSDTQKVTAQIKQAGFDLGVLLPNSFSSSWQFWKGNVKKRVGYASDGRRFLLTHPLPFPLERGKEHLVTTYKRLLLPLDIPLSHSTPNLYVSPSEKIAAKKLLKQLGIEDAKTLVGINPGAAYGSAKCWPPDRFHAVARMLLEENNTALLFFGDQSSAPLIHEICQGLPAGAVNLAGKTSLRELISLIGSCHAFLTNDSGPMHIAAALKTPLVALFGSTNEIATGPYQHGIIIHKHVECSPCYKRTCPIDFRCMMTIHPEEVYMALKKL